MSHDVHNVLLPRLSFTYYLCCKFNAHTHTNILKYIFNCIHYNYNNK